MFHQRNMVRAAAGAILLLCAATAALAQSWPAKPITLVVAYPAGGDTDAIARTYAEKLAQLWVSRCWSTTAPARAA